MEALIESWSGDRSVTDVEAQYDLSDMAMDCVAVMNELLAANPRVGMSMAHDCPDFAINHPDRLASMTSVMSTTGEPAWAGRHPNLLRNS